MPTSSEVLRCQVIDVKTYPEYDIHSTRPTSYFIVALLLSIYIPKIYQNEQKEMVVLKLVRTFDFGVIMALTFKCNNQPLLTQ